MIITNMIVRSIAFAIVGYFVLMFISTNLVGMVVRGFFRNSELEKLKEDGHPFIKKEIAKNNLADDAITVIFAALTLVFLFLLYKYINIWALVAALIFMVSRIPDLLWEIRHGRKVTKSDMPKGGIYTLTAVMDWLPLLVLFWAFYKM